MKRILEFLFIQIIAPAVVIFGYAIFAAIVCPIWITFDWLKEAISKIGKERI
jgi:hypothetical protein